MKPISARINIQQGDITDMDVEAIVNAANNDLILGGGVSGAIHRKGGEAIQAECNRIGSIPVGYAVITGAGKLKARSIIHAASMSLVDMRTTAKSLRTATAHSLRLASDRKFRSVAFPAIGTGSAGFPLEECAQIMLAEAVSHICSGSFPETIYFVLFDAAAEEGFKAVWTQLQANLPSGAATA